MKRVLTRDGAYRLDRDGKLFIAHREAIVLAAYQDGEHMSIGMGDNDPSLKPGDMITIQGAFQRFAKAVAVREEAFSKRIKVEPSQEQFNALFSCFYQSGWRFVPHLLEMHNDHDDVRVIGSAFSRPEYCTNKAGKFMRGLQKRRQLEGALYATGQYEAGLATVGLYLGDPRNPSTELVSHEITLAELPE